MKKLRILIDMDGIVCNTLPYWLAKIAKETNVVAQVEDIKVWDLMKCPPLDRVEAKIVFGLLQRPGFIHNIPMMWGAKEALRQLIEDGHEVYLVTARHGPVSMPETMSWVKEHLPFINAEKQVVFAYDKHILPGDVLIDDKAETLEKYGETHPDALLMAIRYPYNERLEISNAKRYKLFGKTPLDATLTWGQMLGYIQAHAERE